MAAPPDDEGTIIYMHAPKSASVETTTVAPAVKHSSFPVTNRPDAMKQQGNNAPSTAIKSTGSPHAAKESHKHITNDAGKVPPLPPGYEEYAPQIFSPPMVTYHICRICQRPRSDRYHREHPIVPSTVPPPPGICRRCRVTGPDKDVKRARIVHIAESYPVKIGISGIVPASALISRKDMEAEVYERSKNAVRKDEQSAIRRCTSLAAITKKPITYRHISAADALERTRKARAAVVSVENLAHLDRQNARKRDVVHDTKDSRNELQLIVKKQEPSHLPDVGLKAPQADAPVAVPYSESAIRQIARDEVERYRQAERRIDAHPEPYARGRLVPDHELLAETTATGTGKPWWPKETPNPPLEPIVDRKLKRHATEYPRKVENSIDQKPSCSQKSAKSESSQSRKARLEAVYRPVTVVLPVRQYDATTSKAVETDQSTTSHKASYEANVGTSDNKVEARGSSGQSSDNKRHQHTSSKAKSQSSVNQMESKKTSRAAQDHRAKAERPTVSRLDPAPTNRLDYRAEEAVLRDTNAVFTSQNPESTYAAPVDVNADSLSDWTDREYWEDDITIRTASRHSAFRPSTYDQVLARKRSERPGSSVKTARTMLEGDKNAYDSQRAKEAYHARVDRRPSGTYNHNGTMHNDREWELCNRTAEAVKYEEYDERSLQPGRLPPSAPRPSPNDGHLAKPETRGGANQVTATYRVVGADSDVQRSSQVRFANTVDVSPTPPASEDFSPSVNKFTDQRQHRQAERRHDEFFEDHQSSQYGRAQAGRESQWTNARQALDDVKQPSEGIGKKSMRIRSESPSRGVRRLKIQDNRPRYDGSGQVFHGSSFDPQIDRYGPYREELLTDSMLATTGSSRASNPPRGSLREV